MGLITPCWLWEGYQDADGYGHCWIGGRRKNGGGRQLVHRWVYYNLVSKEIEGLDVDHLCTIRNCFNPEHLSACTHEVNITRKEERLYGPIPVLSDEDLEALSQF